MAEAIKFTSDVVLKYQPNLGEEIAEQEFAEGSELTVLQEWDDFWLCKNDDGQLFNVRKSLAEES
jgi:hypothetical protein